MERFSREMDEFWKSVEDGTFVPSPAQVRLAERLLELFPDHLLK